MRAKKCWTKKLVGKVYGICADGTTSIEGKKVRGGLCPPCRAALVKAAR